MISKRKKLLTFKQDDKFYYQRAMKLIDDNEFVRGIKMLNVAIKQNPKNIEYRMALCDVLTDIGYYTKSIDEIVNIMIIDEKFDAKCYYMLGYNYYELGDYVKALNMFERFLSLDDESELGEEVLFFLEHIEQDSLASWENYSIFPNHLYSTKSDITNIEETRMSDDIEIWSREQNIKALMAYSKKDYAETTKICQNILSKLPRQSSVLCTMSLSLAKEGKTEESINVAKSLTETVQDNWEDLFRVSFVLCELKMDQEAREILKKLKQLMPYDEKVNHYLATAHYNCGDFESARKLWNVCYEINGESNKYNWYIENTLSPRLKRLDYSDYLPNIAVVENISYLEKLISKKEEQPDFNCWDDTKFKKIVLESLEKCNEDIQKRLLKVIFEFAGDEREGIFRKFLLSDNIGEKNKNEILSFLHIINAKEPFLMMTDYQLVDVAINVISVDNNSKEDFVKVLNYAVNNLCSDKKQKEKLISFWSVIAVKFMQDNKRIKNITLWAVGFYCTALAETLSEEEINDIVKQQGITKRSLNSVIKMINGKKEDEDDY